MRRTEDNKYDLEHKEIAEQNVVVHLANTLNADGQEVLGAFVLKFGNLSVIPLPLIQQMVIFLPAEDLITLANDNPVFFPVIEKTPQAQETLRLYAINPMKESIKTTITEATETTEEAVEQTVEQTPVNFKVPLTEEQRKYLDTDLVKYRIRNGFLTVKKALSESSPANFTDHSNAEIIKLGFSSVDITRKNAPSNRPGLIAHYQHGALLKKYASQLIDQDLGTVMSGMAKPAEIVQELTEEIKIDAEALSCKRAQKLDALSCKRAQKLDAFFKAMCLWSNTQASAFMAGLSVEQVESLPSHSNFTVEHVNILKQETPENFGTKFEEIKDLSRAQLIVRQNPLGFSEQWIRAENFSLEAYHLVHDSQHLPKEQRVRPSDLEKLNVGQARLLAGGVPLSKVLKLDPKLPLSKMDEMSKGLAAGFTWEDVQSDWFSDDHLKIVQGILFIGSQPSLVRMIPVERVRGLTKGQVCLLAQGVSLEKIQNVDPTVTSDKMKEMAAGLGEGFTWEDVQSNWFTQTHISLSRGQLSFGDYPAPTIPAKTLRGLSLVQVNGLVIGLSVEQVSRAEYIAKGDRAPWIIRNKMKKGVTFEEAIAAPVRDNKLKKWQQISVEDNSDSEDEAEKPMPLTAEQVTQPWFTPHHLLVVSLKIASYEDIQGFTVTQVKGLMANLTCEQVNHSWFKAEHLMAIEEGISYDSIRGLSIKAVRQVREEQDEVTCVASSSAGHSISSSSNFQESKRSATVTFVAPVIGPRPPQEAADAALAQQITHLEKQRPLEIQLPCIYEKMFR